MIDLTMNEDEIIENLDRFVAAVLERRPAMAGVVLPFASIFKEKALIVKRLTPDLEVDKLGLDFEGLASGLYLLSGRPLDSLSQAFDASFAGLAPVLIESFPGRASDFKMVKKYFDQEKLNLPELARNLLEGSGRAIESTAEEIGVSPGCLGYMGGYAVSAVLQALTPVLSGELKKFGWQKGYCPVCGSLPAVSFLSAPLEEAGEYLKGGGGAKYLHCALCGCDWRLNRNVCPACGTDDKDQRFYLEVQGESGERVDICRACGLYLPCLDLRQTHLTVHPDMASISLLHLDLLARQKGFQPMSWTPWNRME